MKVQDVANAFSISRTAIINAVARMRRKLDTSEQLQKDLKAIIAHLKASRLTSSSLSRPDA